MHMLLEAILLTRVYGRAYFVSSYTFSLHPGTRLAPSQQKPLQSTLNHVGQIERAKHESNISLILGQHSYVEGEW